MVMFLFISGIQFRYIGISSSKLAIIVLIFSLVVNKKYIYIPKSVFISVFFIIMLLLMAICALLVNQSNDLSFVRIFGWSIIESFIFGMLFVRSYGEINMEGILVTITWAIFVQSIIILSMFLAPAFKDFVYSLEVNSHSHSKALINLSNPTRGLGLGGDGVTGTGIIQGLGLIIMPYIKEYFKRKRLFSIVYFPILVSSVMSARSALLAVGLSFIAFVMMSNKKILTLIIIILTVILLVCLFSYYIDLFNGPILYWIFEPFVNYYWDKQLYTSSTNDLLTNHLFKITDIKTIIIGDGKYASESGYGYYMNTDSGYLRNIFYYGLIGSLTLYCFYLNITKTLIKRYKSIDTKFTYFVILYVMYIFLLHIKGDVLITVNILGLIQILYFRSVYEYRIPIKKREY